MSDKDEDKVVVVDCRNIAAYLWVAIGKFPRAVWSILK